MAAIPMKKTNSEIIARSDLKEKKIEQSVKCSDCITKISVTDNTTTLLETAKNANLQRGEYSDAFILD